MKSLGRRSEKAKSPERLQLLDRNYNTRSSGVYCQNFQNFGSIRFIEVSQIISLEEASGISDRYFSVKSDDNLK